MARSAQSCLAALGLAFAMTGILGAAQAAALTLPEGAEVIADQALAPGEVLVPTGPWTLATGLPAERVAGQVTVQSWRLSEARMTTLDLMTTLRDELAQDGFSPGFACQADDCGGFDFRFSIRALPEPQMHVDLGDFRFLVASRPGNGGADHVLVLVSRGPGTLYAQITQVSRGSAASVTRPSQDPVPDPLVPDPADPAPAKQTAKAAVPGGVVAALLQNGGVSLDDLAFAPGAAQLLEGDYVSLSELGGWLAANPSVGVVLVGHTDASGGLAGNIALSKRRAEAVRQWLTQSYDLKEGQVGAEGVGYLAPRASNDSDAGRARNRRVEVMVTSTR